MPCTQTADGWKSSVTGNTYASQSGCNGAEQLAGMSDQQVGDYLENEYIDPDFMWDWVDDPDYFKRAGNNIATSTNDFVQRYGFYLVAAGAFLLLWLMWPMFSKKGK